MCATAFQSVAAGIPDFGSRRFRAEAINAVNASDVAIVRQSRDCERGLGGSWGSSISASIVSIRCSATCRARRVRVNGCFAWDTNRTIKLMATMLIELLQTLRSL